jgi:hypothetical protein
MTSRETVRLLRTSTEEEGLVTRLVEASIYAYLDTLNLYITIVIVYR